MNDIRDEAEKNLSEAARNVDKLDADLPAAIDKFARLLALRRAGERKFLVYLVGGLYAFSVAAIILYLFFRSICAPEDAFDNIFEVVKVAVIPIVTLVIGYYFAAEKAT